MVSREEILGDRERREVGVDGIEEEEKETLDGYGSLNLAGAREGDEQLEGVADVALPFERVGCEF